MVAVLSLILLCFGTAANANLVTNGNFETGTLSGWNASGVVQAYGGYGSNAAVFNGGDNPPNGVLTQTLATSNGHHYALSFDYGVVTYWPSSQSMFVEIQGSSGQLASLTVTDPSASAPASLNRYALDFWADGPSVTLRFVDVAGNFTLSTDGIVDNVVVGEVPVVGGLELRWAYCSGGEPIKDLSWYCAGGESVLLFGTFQMPDLPDSLVSMDGQLTITTEAPTLPQFWHMELDACNADGFTFDFAKPTECGTNAMLYPTWGSAGQWISTAAYTPIGGNRAALRFTVFRTPVTVFSTPIRFFGFMLVLDALRAQQYGGPCAGCEKAVCIQWDWAKLTTSQGASVILQGPGTQGNTVTLNSPASSCVQTSEVSHAAGTDVAPVRAYPNPFRDDVSVEFGVPTGALVRMEVFDVQGRRVFATGAVYFPSGRHVLKWDGRNDHGNAPPKGTYRVRISGRGFEATRSVILLNR